MQDKEVFFGYILTRYMLSLEVPEYPRYDEVEEAPKGLMYITVLLDTTTKLSTSASNEREENFNRYIYRSINLMMRQLVVTDDERMHFNVEYSLFGASNEMLGITSCRPIYLFEDENVIAGSDAEGDTDDKVVGPLTLVQMRMRLKLWPVCILMMTSLSMTRKGRTIRESFFPYYLCVVVCYASKNMPVISMG